MTTCHVRSSPELHVALISGVVGVRDAAGGAFAFYRAKTSDEETWEVSGSVY